MKKLIVASITPFDGQDQINEQAVKQLWDRNLAEGADGFFIGGSSGECFLLSERERIHTYELGAQYLDRAEIFAHVGAIRTAEAVTYAKEARALGFRISRPPRPFTLDFRPRRWRTTITILQAPPARRCCTTISPPAPTGS